MAALYAFLAFWIVGLFGLIGICIAGLAHLIKHDTWAYDEAFVWRRKVRE